MKANQQPIALLLSDVGLPGASGAELVRQARRLMPELPTLLMSARSKQALARDGVLEGEPAWPRHSTIEARGPMALTFEAGGKPA